MISIIFFKVDTHLCKLRDTAAAPFLQMFWIFVYTIWDTFCSLCRRVQAWMDVGGTPAAPFLQMFWIFVYTRYGILFAVFVEGFRRGWMWVVHRPLLFYRCFGYLYIWDTFCSFCRRVQAWMHVGGTSSTRPAPPRPAASPRPLPSSSSPSDCCDSSTRPKPLCSVCLPKSVTAAPEISLQRVFAPCCCDVRALCCAFFKILECELFAALLVFMFCLFPVVTAANTKYNT